MICLAVKSKTRPERILIRTLPGMLCEVRMADNIEEIEEEGETCYQYDESAFVLDHTATEEEVEENWDTYWNYVEPQPPEPVKPMTNEELTERIDIIEGAIVELSEEIYGQEGE